MDGAAGTSELSGAWAGIGISRRFTLEAVELWWVEIPFVAPVSTAIGVHRSRPLVFVRLRGASEGQPVEGWGECAALADTTYDEEDVAAAFSTLERRLIPALIDLLSTERHLLPGPSGLDPVRRVAPESPMAFSALEMAVADAHLRSEGRPWARLLDVDRMSVEVGAVVGTYGTVDALLAEVRRLVADGYSRLKMKIGPGWDVDPVAAVTAAAPDLRLQVDANGSYSESDSAHLGRLDQFGLLCLEQPFERTQLEAHARLAARLDTPICLDESLDSPERVEHAIALGACSVVCVKPARLGGLGAAIEVIGACGVAGIPVWMGGMYESGYARGVDAALAALPGFAWPGDLSPTRGYLVDDVVPAPGLARTGPGRAPTVPLPRGAGMGPCPAVETLFRHKVRCVELEVSPG